MIDKLVITNFKCHDRTEINIKPFTLLVGTNSSGKSSTIQALLLAIQNSSVSAASSALNGHLVSVGYFYEARNIVNNAKSFEIQLSGENGYLEFEFSPKQDDGKRENAKAVVVKENDELYNYLDYANKNIHYLSAHRIGGQDLYNRNLDNYDIYGLNGEYAIDFLEHNQEMPLDDELIIDDSSKTLVRQVNHWLNYIFGHTVNTDAISGTDKVMANFPGPTPTTHVRPKNIGSGISYAIAIIIVCLSSKKGNLIIIENPEIHLHPRAQALLTEFFVLIANSGRKLIIETHSDHIFNGLRVRVKDKEISTENISINFFTLDKVKLLSRHTDVKLSAKGRITNSEDFLFDQFENDINALLDIY